MRICLVAHGFPPLERTGVENYTAALAAALAGKGHVVRVFAPRPDATAPHLSVRREVRAEFEVHWLTVNRSANGPREQLDLPAAARQFGHFLERERPEVVHFQHIVKLGIGLIYEARDRAIPTLYTAHDYYSICHRYTLLRPDLSHCDVRGDSMQCAQCDVALGFLNRKEELGDYQMGVLPAQLTDDERGTLAEILAGDVPAGACNEADVDAAFDLRRELDGQRAEAFAALDRILAPSRYLKGELVRGGLLESRIEVLDYGIENADLLGVPPIQFDGSRPVRFAFFGGLSKHKGVHVLIEAFEAFVGASGAAELSIWGYSTDAPYVEALRAAAAAAGAVWHGAYERHDLPGLLADVDVVIVPSTWVENQPLVIREAFSAGRPVIASDIGALPESVRDGVDGLLFAVGNADSLARQMDRCARDPELVRKLAGAIQPVKGVERQAEELLERYAALIESLVVPTRTDLPRSLASFADRFDHWQGVPTRELFRSAFERLGGLRMALCGDATGGAVDEIVQAALSASDPKSQLDLREARAEQDWLRDLTENKVEEARWLRGTLQDKEKELTWFRGRLQELTGEREKLEGALAQIEKDLKEAAELGLAAIEAQEHMIGSEIRPVLADLHQLFGGELDVPAEGILQLTQHLNRNIRLALFELVWRREEMRLAGTTAHRRLPRFLMKRTRLGRRVVSWQATDEAMTTELGEGTDPTAGGDMPEDGSAPDGDERGDDE